MNKIKIDKKIVSWKVASQENKEENDNRPKSILTSYAPKRPKSLPCDIKKAKVAGESWIFFIGLFEGKPYEIFGGLSKYVDIPNKCKTAELIKNGKVDGLSTYKIIIGEGEDQIIITDIGNVFENANHGAFTRMISLSMRHGTPVEFIVDQLTKDKHSDITSFSKVVARVLKGYIVEGAEVKTSGAACPSCGSTKLVYQAGCASCQSCTWSRCQ